MGDEAKASEGGEESQGSVESTFKSYTGGQSQMDGRSFVKLLQDIEVIDKTSFTTVDADLIFTKVKRRGCHKIELQDFKKALGMVAARKKEDEGTLLERVASSTGPKLKCTKADAVKYHDDKSLYTGVHVFGGPSTVDHGRTEFHDLSAVTDRSGYTARGVGVKVASNVAKQSQRKQDDKKPQQTRPSK